MDEQKKLYAENISTAPLGVSDEEVTIDLMELAYRLLARWKLLVCLALCLTILVGAYTVLLVTPLYQATSTIYVLNRRDTAINMSDLQIGSALTSDYAKVFKMWEVHEQVIDNLGLPYSYDYMAKHLSVKNESNTRMLDITFTSPNPSEAANVANEYAKVASQYIADTMAMDKPSIMSVALAPVNPVSPSIVRNAMICFLLGLVIGMGFVTVQMLMDDKYKTTDDIMKYTGMNTLAVIPIEEEMKRENRGDREKRSARRDA